jgi:hypothetical protein
MSTHALADTSMSTSTEWLVGRLGTLADGSVTIINLVATVVVLQSLVCNTLLVDPSVRVPNGRVLPDGRVHLGDTRRGKDEVALGDDVRNVLFRDSRGSDRSGHRHIRHDLAHDRAADEDSQSQSKRPSSYV